MVCLNRRGGTLKCAARLADALAAHGPVRMIISAHARGELLPENVELVRVPSGTSRTGNVLHTLSPASYHRVVSRVRRFQPTVVHVPVEHAWNMIVMPLLNRCPVVQTIHDPVRHVGLESRFYDFLRRMELARADRVIVLSDCFRQAFTAAGMPPERVDFVPHGQFAFGSGPWGQSFPEPPMSKRILFAGTIQRYKGVGVLLKAFPAVLEKHPDATLTIAGQGDLSPWAALVREARNVTVINRYITEEELAALHAECDFVAVPYIDASQSGVVSTALANGRAVVATKVGGLAAQIADGTTGLLVEPGNVGQLAGAMIDLLDNPERIGSLGRRARATYAEQFAWPRIAQRTMDVYAKAQATFRARQQSGRVPNLWQAVLQAIGARRLTGMPSRFRRRT